jgi:deazaflavin-dependent oxidoreductase (nitroreductase family)
MALRTITRWYGNLFNKRVRHRLRSENHQLLSNNHLLITVTGRRTGKQYTIPVNYRRFDDGNLVIGTEADWWHNLKGGAEVELLVAGETLRGYAEPIHYDAARRELGMRLLAPGFGRFYRSLVVIEIAVDREMSMEHR